MSSIKINSDISRVFELIEKSLNSNIEVIKRYTEDPTFDASANKTSTKIYNSINQNESSQDSEFEDLYEADLDTEYEYDDMDTTNYYNSPDSYEDVFDQSKEAVVRNEQRRQPEIKRFQSEERHSMNTSRRRLREAVVWSEILGPPACKSRHTKGRARRYMKSY